MVLGDLATIRRLVIVIFVLSQKRTRLVLKVLAKTPFSPGASWMSVLDMMGYKPFGRWLCVVPSGTPLTLWACNPRAQNHGDYSPRDRSFRATTIIAMIAVPTTTIGSPSASKAGNMGANDGCRCSVLGFLYRVLRSLWSLCIGYRG